jgi:hypothetical protein
MTQPPISRRPVACGCLRRRPRSREQSRAALPVSAGRVQQDEVATRMQRSDADGCAAYGRLATKSASVSQCHCAEFLMSHLCRQDVDRAAGVVAWHGAPDGGAVCRRRYLRDPGRSPMTSLGGFRHSERGEGARDPWACASPPMAHGRGYRQPASFHAPKDPSLCPGCQKPHAIVLPGDQGHGRRCRAGKPATVMTPAIVPRRRGAAALASRTMPVRRACAAGRRTGGCAGRWRRDR